MIIKTIYRLPLVQLPLKFVKYNFNAYLYPLFNRKRFQNLRSYAGVGKGKRIFIVATGPSLTVNDLNLIKDETSMSCNSIVHMFGKTKWRPTYYTVVDHAVFKKIQNDIYRLKQEIKVFFHPFTINYNEANSQCIKWKRVLASTPRERAIVPDKWRQPKIGTNITKVLHEDSSVMHACMQIAISMGFSEIYLLGCDTTFVGHADGLEHNLKDNKNTPYDYHIGAINDYKAAKKTADKLRIKIFNATRGGQLEVFQRVELEDILKKNT